MVLSDVFISYSRKDAPFVRSLNTKLVEAGKEVWIDWEDIPYSSTWWDEIEAAIIGTSTFICILSDDYLKSDICNKELALASKLNKKFIPIQYKDFDIGLNTHNTISKTNWLPFTEAHLFNNAFDKLLETINLDLEWVKFHTRLAIRASEWSSNNSDSSYHLYGEDLEEAINKVENNKGNSPALTTLQRNYIEASKAGAKEIVRKQLRGFYLAALLYSFAQIFVIYFWNFDDMSETAMIKMSWVWLPGFCFAIAGLTIGKYKLRTAFIATGIAVVLFLLFYAVLWPLL